MLLFLVLFVWYFHYLRSKNLTCCFRALPRGVPGTWVLLLVNPNQLSIGLMPAPPTAQKGQKVDSDELLSTEIASKT